MAVTIIADGNMKACYKICQHQHGERFIDVVTRLSLNARCKASHSRGTLYSPQHALLHAGTHFDEDESISTRTRLQVKLGKDEGACQKTHTVYARHSAGFLGAFCPCGVCVGRPTLATAESENEVTYFLHTLSKQGTMFDATAYDDCCHLVPMLRCLKLLNGCEFFIPRFHQYSHKHTKYKADLIVDVPGVNTGAAEQRFKRLRRMAGVVMNTTELNWNFNVDMVLLTFNELGMHGGVASEMHRRYVEPSPLEEDPKNPETWVLDRPPVVSFSAALQGCVLHLGKKLYRQATWYALHLRHRRVEPFMRTAPIPLIPWWLWLFRQRIGCLLHAHDHSCDAGRTSCGSNSG